MTAKQKTCEVLIVEDNREPAQNIARRLVDRGCNCTLMLCRTLQEFVREFDALFPQGTEPASLKSFDGTVLDAMFHKQDGQKQLDGGFLLYQYWQQRGILPYLGVILVATEADSEIRELFANLDVRMTVKGNSRILDANLNDFVSNMDC